MPTSTNILFALQAMNALPNPVAQVTPTSRTNRIRVIFESVAMMEITSCAKDALGVMLRGSGLTKMRISFSDTTGRVFGNELENISDEERVFLACFGTERMPSDEHLDVEKLQRLARQARYGKALWQLIESELEPLWNETEKAVSDKVEQRVLSGESFQDVMENVLREYIGKRSLLEIYEAFVSQYADCSPALSAMADGIPIEDIIA